MIRKGVNKTENCKRSSQDVTFSEKKQQFLPKLIFFISAHRVLSNTLVVFLNPLGTLHRYLFKKASNLSTLGQSRKLFDKLLLLSRCVFFSSCCQMIFQKIRITFVTYYLFTIIVSSVCQPGISASSDVYIKIERSYKYNTVERSYRPPVFGPIALQFLARAMLPAKSPAPN